MTLKELYTFIDVEMIDKLIRYSVEIDDVIIHDLTNSEIRFEYHAKNDNKIKIRSKLLKWIESEIVNSYLKDKLEHNYYIQFASSIHGLSVV